MRRSLRARFLSLLTGTLWGALLASPALLAADETNPPSPAPATAPAAPAKPPATPAPIPALDPKFRAFEPKTYGSDGHQLVYRLYQPAHLEPGQKVPLVLFLHGYGERGDDNRLQLKGFGDFPFWEKYPCIIVAPQCPNRGVKAETRWVDVEFGALESTMKPEPNGPLRLVMGLLDETLAKYPIDPKRVYLTGLSMGGFATWEMLQRQPGKFAAAMPICGGADLAQAEKLVHVPLWIFHGGADGTVKTQRSRDIVQRLEALGGKPKYTEYPGVGHNSWTPTYQNPEVWDWLFAQHQP